MRYAYAALLAAAMACHRPAPAAYAPPAPPAALVEKPEGPTFSMWLIPVICVDDDPTCKPRQDEWVREHSQGYTVLNHQQPVAGPPTTCPSSKDADIVCIDWLDHRLPVIVTTRTLI
jgi:hypothetical protein